MIGAIKIRKNLQVIAKCRTVNASEKDRELNYYSRSNNLSHELVAIS